MANTYSQLTIHIVFAVKNRENLIKPKYKEELYKYIKGIITNIEGVDKKIVKSLHQKLLNKRLDYQALTNHKNMSSDLINLVHNLVY